MILFRTDYFPWAFHAIFRSLTFAEWSYFIHGAHLKRIFWYGHGDAFVPPLDFRSKKSPAKLFGLCSFSFPLFSLQANHLIFEFFYLDIWKKRLILVLYYVFITLKCDMEVAHFFIPDNPLRHKMRAVEISCLFCARQLVKYSFV